MERFHGDRAKEDAARPKTLRPAAKRYHLKPRAPKAPAESTMTDIKPKRPTTAPNTIKSR
jgi:hypothetical protein